MASVWGVLFIIAGLVISVALHELGHMLFARLFGVPVPEFAVGFGPKIFSRRWRGTTYSLRAIPLGGFVRIPGMFPPAPARTRLTNRRGEPTLAEQARAESAASLPVGQENHAFYLLSAPRKILVMLAGPLMNLLICIVLTAIAMCGIGYQAPTTTVAQVLPTVSTARGEMTGPAAASGLVEGDVIEAINGATINEWSEVQQAIAQAPTRTVDLTVKRANQHIRVTLTPETSESGQGIAGIVAGTAYRSASLAQLWQMNTTMAQGTVALIIRLPQAVWKVAVSVVTDAPRDSQGLISVVGVGRIAAEVTGESTALGVRDIRQSLSVLLMLLASLNMALCIFNVLPLPPLDGGHIMGALYEGMRRRIVLWRGGADPGPADTARLMPLTYVVGASLLVMTVILVLADIIKPISVT
ncbi:M50 family metallopeptidase [Schaalia sp. lx-260]|uniref:M50 family metallopeptidase n=1 Tax=Schaalia sp. lx-260 TaxID=2899082 RepID=UPI001E28432D|nr:M50 family metallopeptidase [Schaalia sp. lx-260]MCD4549327.1 M50 family metallopeptidase [Schaalia sp. lx-260]